MNAIFERSFDKTSIHEGGYNANKNGLDKGGETYRGIARNYWPGWKGWEIIDAAKRENKSINNLKNKVLDGLVLDFYFDNFWNPLKLPKIDNQEVADELFDTAVNMGLNRSARFLQESLNLLGERVTVDGRIGEKTIAAANRVDATMLVRLLNIFQGQRYVEIVRGDPTQRAHFRSWLSRTVESKESKTAKPAPAPEGDNS